MKLLPLAFSLMLAGMARLAAQVETQHAFDVSVRVTARLDLVMHARMRTQPGGLGYYQGRGGPVLEYRLNGWFKAVGGYYYAQQESRFADFIGGHRWFGGGEGSICSTASLQVNVRVLAERFALQQSRDFNRYRARVRLSGRRSVAPHASAENFFDARGWRSTRYAAGLRVGNGSPVSFDLGYFLEPRRADLGGTRHMFMTSFQWNIGSKRRTDPDM